MGGIDLCLGREDDKKHLISDQKKLLWLGQDYSNPFVKDFSSLEKYDRGFFRIRFNQSLSLYYIILYYIILYYIIILLFIYF